MSPETKQRLNQAATALRNANSILLSCHVRPDADALGSLLGLTLGLRQLGKAVRPVSPDGVPKLYRYLPGWELIVTDSAGSFDVGVGLDADGSDRLGSAEPAILACPTCIDIDHHTGPDQFGDIRVVEPKAAATGELVFWLLQEMDVALTPEISACLLSAIQTDTGSFRFTNVHSDTFRIAAELVAAGAHPSPLYEAVYGVRSFGASKLLGRLMSSLERSADGRVVWASISHADFRELGLETDETEGFVDQLRMVEGSEIAVFLREEKTGEIRVSLRSRGRANVAAVAAEFGGGGHLPAAGCTLPGPLPAAVDTLVAAALRQSELAFGTDD